MAKVLTTKSEIKCAHQGTLTFTPSHHILKVDGHEVLVEGDHARATVSKCPIPNNPDKGTKKCSKVSLLIAGRATKLKVDGVAVLLATAWGMTDGAAPLPGTWSVKDASQKKLDAK